MGKIYFAVLILKFAMAAFGKAILLKILFMLLLLKLLEVSNFTNDDVFHVHFQKYKALQLQSVCTVHHTQ